MAKKYFWLKMQENFFDREEIKILDSLPNGGETIIFYLKLLLKSIPTEGQLLYREKMPYTDAMLAAITGMNEAKVKDALKLLEDLQLIKREPDGTLMMQEHQNMVGSETEWAQKKREYRQKQDGEDTKEDNDKTKEGQPEDNEGQCPTDIDIELDIEIEKEIEKEDKAQALDDSPEFLIAKELEKILFKSKPDSKQPNLQSWAKDIGLMLRVDKKAPQDIIDLFRWAQGDTFWVANIRSARKLREKWDTLELQRGRPKQKENGNIITLGALYERAIREERQ